MIIVSSSTTSEVVCVCVRACACVRACVCVCARACMCIAVVIVIILFVFDRHPPFSSSHDIPIEELTHSPHSCKNVRIR
jgi:hypothetical protein